MAARIRRELGVEVEMVRGRQGEFKLPVDGDTVIDGGAMTLLGVSVGAEDRRGRAGAAVRLIGRGGRDHSQNDNGYR